MTIREALSAGTKKLASSKSTSVALDAEVLLSYALGKSKDYVFSNPNRVLLRNKLRNYNKLLNLRAQGWPVAYLTQTKQFYGLEFHVDKNVLIPRPETEGLVDLTLGEAKSLKVKGKKSIKILDIGTGSGCIIIRIAKNHETHPSRLTPHPFFFASDISMKALKIAKRNAKKHKVKIHFKKGSLLQPWKGRNFDIIVANLPYLEKETDSSTKYEPKQALVASKKGLGLIEQLLIQISRLTTLPSSLLLEFGHDQSKKIKNLAEKYLPDSDVKIYKDLSGKNRYAIIRPSVYRQPEQPRQRQQQVPV